jgi:hypothetical protein
MEVLKMFDNYDVVELLNEYKEENPILLDIIFTIENKGILQGTKI